jgi:GT2 family glycosyltransferase
MISIIIVSYNRLDLVEKCLVSAVKYSPKDTEIILVDNNSTEDIVGFVKKTYPKIKIIANPKNLGFAKGNNQGMRAAKGEYFLLLNTDAFLEKNAVSTLTKFLDYHPDAGAVGPKLLNANGSLQPSAGYFPNLLTVFLIMSTIDNWPFFKKFLPSIHVRNPQAFSKTRTFDWVTGACIMIPRSVYNLTHGFDENYFMYGEELEWQYRINKLGIKSYYLPTAKATHLGFSSSSPANGAIKELQSIIEFNKKYSPGWQIPLIKAIIILGCILRIIRGLIQPKSRWMVLAYYESIRNYFKF